MMTKQKVRKLFEYRFYVRRHQKYNGGTDLDICLDPMTK